MKKLIVAFGLILICIGIILISRSNDEEPKMGYESVTRGENVWSVLGELKKDDKITIEITPPTEWSEGAFDEVYAGEEQRGVLHVLVNISSPQANPTLFIVDYTPVEWKGAYIATIWNISLVQGSVDSGWDITYVPDLENDSLDTWSVYDDKADPPHFFGVGGTVEYNGSFNVTVGHIYPSRTTAPTVLEIFRGKPETIYPYSSFLPIGAATVVAGASITFFGLRTKQKKFFSKRKRR